MHTCMLSDSAHSQSKCKQYYEQVHKDIAHNACLQVSQFLDRTYLMMTLAALLHLHLKLERAAQRHVGSIVNFMRLG